jgi:glycosyltransferase involved in cell wall biosynthesis
LGADDEQSTVDTNARAGVDASASIVVNNHNYGCYLADALESALTQTFPRVEVVVVDDGSTDDSREIIGRYADRVVPVFKANGGQASAMNAGFARSSGDVVIFLDADDMLERHTAERAMACFADQSLVKVQWPLLEVDADGRSLDTLTPGSDIPEGDLRARLYHEGPANIAWPATSGNAWARWFLEEVLPIDERVYRMGADTYLFELAPFVGPLKTLDEPLSRFRKHGRNHSRSLTFAARMELELGFADHYFPLIEERCRRAGVEVDSTRWRARSWWHRLALAAQEIAERIPPGERFALIDDAAWAMDTLEGRAVLPFPEDRGVFAGQPADDAGACAELEKLRRLGVRYLVIGWPAFWWLDYYSAFAKRIAAASTVQTKNERFILAEFRW